MFDLEPYDCDICKARESVETTIDDIEGLQREVCTNCGYVFVGAADPWEIEENEKIVQMIAQEKYIKTKL
ncbi:hypothetical protein [Bacillus pacificus]|uniref:hypothetical protein n=1 Tax=Bacillus pacificus TaxID=2026187 RepID=UPI001D0DFFAB|nr:hypothetical protein [Bacillus pacificus]MCC2351980.1 hypothetical protein [Bacillus pacificus]MCU5247327.1 hypothetical protein [Bacillus pacificus]MCU5467428.1 hypothetical protein [Bacillus pacificus]